MQKIELIQNLEEIVERLRSMDIVKIFREGFSQSSLVYPYEQITPILFHSKSQFDQMIKDDRLKSTLELIHGNKIYDVKVMAELPHILIPTQAHNVIMKQNAANFYSFHSGLIDTLMITKKLLTNDLISNSFSENLDQGIIVFNVSIENEGINASNYIKIFSLIDELVKTLNKIYKKDVAPDIIYLDSGSDANIGLKTDIEIAKSIFQIFKEIWDFITSFKFYRAQQKNQALIESLSIRREIDKMVEEGHMNEKEAQEYVHYIKTRTDELIGLKVIPRILVSDSKVIDSKHMLEEYSMKMLKENK